VHTLAWLAIPVVALVLAVLWAVWASRTPPRADTHDTLEQHARFRAAFDPQHTRRGRRLRQHRD
jgi:hypothetical protein